jgi:hypothetical protein
MSRQFSTDDLRRSRSSSFGDHSDAGVSFHVVIRHGVLRRAASGVTASSTEITLCAGCHG